MDFGVAIHLYDKTDELQTNVNIIRNHWNINNDAFISVHCNDRDSFKTVLNMDINKKLLYSAKFSNVPKTNQRMRCHDTVVRSIIENKADWVIQWHSDAYAIDPNNIISLINHMKENGIKIAFRGRGFDFRSGKSIHGHIDDHFMIVDRKEFIKRKPCDLPLMQYLTRYFNESLWGYFIQTRYDKNEYYHYCDMKNNEAEFIKEVDEGTDWWTKLNPYNIDHKRKFYHIGDKKLTEPLLCKEGVEKSLIYITDKKQKGKYRL